jgi:CHASE2 domain-containing sensor protein
MSYYGVPQLQPQQQPPPVAPVGAIDGIDPSQKVSSRLALTAGTQAEPGAPKAMLLQVLRLTQDQISQLPPAERDAILALVSLPYEGR